MIKEPPKSPALIGLKKTPTGIQGLDEITGGGLPRGRPTLVCGSAGCGKTLLAMEFLVRGATQYNEPGVFMSFEETAEELTKNVASLGFDLDKLTASKKFLIDHVRIERSEIEETGEYDLEGLFIRLGSAVDAIKAKRVVLDTIESLFAGLGNPSILRAELRRLFRWLKEKGLTTIITGEKGENTLTRHGLEEYVSDCVIILDHRVSEQLSTRRLRVLKYRGTSHGTSEFPFLIDEKGISVLPITSIGLDHPVSERRISSGIPRLDAMLEGKGYYRGSTVLITGTAGTGKSSIAAHFVDAACRRGERSVYFAFEESKAQIIRNMRSIGLDLQPWAEKKLLHFFTERSTLYGLEAHLLMMQKVIARVKPAVVVIDPITNFLGLGNDLDVKAMLTRLIDFLKLNQTTALFTTLTSAGAVLEQSQVNISSLADTWLLLRDIELGGERNRALYILKSRGMAHSNQIREFLLTDRGVDLVDAYVGPSGVLTGTARLTQEIKEREAEAAYEEESDRKKRELENKRRVLELQIASLQARFKNEEEELRRLLSREKSHHQEMSRQQETIARSRKVNKKLGRRSK